MFRLSLRFIVLTSLLVLVAPSFAAEPNSGPVGRISVTASAIEWDPVADHEAIVLKVQEPDGDVQTETFRAGQRPVFRLGERSIDGAYSYELRAVPRISAQVREKLAAARDDHDAARLQRESGLGGSIVQSGTLSVVNGAFVLPGAVEPRTTGAPWRNKPIANPTLSGDTYIVGGQLCVGFDCTGSESLAFKTILLKENNDFIHFEDTSTTAGFASNDWRIQVNDTFSGGVNKFVIEDVTSAKVPFYIEGNAATNSIYIDSTGRIGFRTSTPALDLHITTTNSPAMRFEQTSGGGFPAQTWDIGANNVNFFVRDVTAGNLYPFRIRPGAPSGAMDIGATGVGINCLFAASDLVIASGGGCSNPSSSMNAGDSQFTVASSRTFKENLSRVEVSDVLEKIETIDVYEYDFVNGPKDRVGLIAEDFHQIFGRGSEKYINGQEVQMALWLAVKELAAQNKALRERIEDLEQK